MPGVTALHIQELFISTMILAQSVFMKIVILGCAIERLDQLFSNTISKMDSTDIFLFTEIVSHMVVRLVLQVKKKNKSVVCINPDGLQTSVSKDVDEEGTLKKFLRLFRC